MSESVRDYFDRRQEDLDRNFEDWERTYRAWKSDNPDSAKLLEDALNGKGDE